jgi:hypothetical protein
MEIQLPTAINHALNLSGWPDDLENILERRTGRLDNEVLRCDRCPSALPTGLGCESREYGYRSGADKHEADPECKRPWQSAHRHTIIKPVL